jgi:putative ABC transport system permease protein
MTTLWQDVVYGFRMLMKKPGFTAIAAFSLALGIGANTAIFSLVNTVLLSSLNYRDPSRLVMVETTPPGHPETSEPATVPDYIAWKEQNRSFEMLGAGDGGLLDLGVGENGRAPERLEGEGFSPAVFEILGVRPLLGRTFTADEDAIGAPAPVLLISHRLWQRRFASDRNIAGKTIRTGTQTVTIIGVMPPDFHLADENADFWQPLSINRFQLQDRGRTSM